LAAGTYSFLAVYSGNPNYPSFTSVCEPFTVLPGSPWASPTISTSPSPTSLTLTTTASTLTDSTTLSGGYNPTGVITFTLYKLGSSPSECSDIVDVESAPVSGDGTYTTPVGYTLPTTGTVTGTYAWVVTYGGDPNNNAVSSPADASCTDSTETASVLPASPTITTTASTVVTLTTTAPTISDSATLSGGYYPTGTIMFTLTGPSGFSYTQSDTVSGNGAYSASVTLPTSGTVAGTYTWSATYSGDANNNGASETGSVTNGEQTQVLEASPSLTTTPSPSAVTLSTSSVTLMDTATISGGYYPTGTITFTLYLGSTLVNTETASVSGNGVYTTPTGYTLPTTGTVTGTYQWDASYSGDGNNVGVSENNAANEQVVVGPAATSTTLACTTPVTVGSPSTCKATVSGNYGSLNGETISFSALPATSGIFGSTTCFLSGGSCYVIFTPSPGHEGTISMTATYGGDGNNLGSHASSSIAAQSATTTVVACLPLTGTVGVSETCAVAVANNDLKDNVHATGTVTFVGTLPKGMPGSCTLSGGLGFIAICTVTWTPPSGSEGTYRFSASYGGDATHAPIGSGQWTLQISKRSVSVSLSCSGSFRHNTPITCSVTVADTSPGTPITPTGTVSFSGALSIPACSLTPLSPTKASCQVTFTASSPGYYAVTANYGGDTDHLTGWATTSFKVN